MSVNRLLLRAGQHSQAGTKEVNDDSCGMRIPDAVVLRNKGALFAVADGVGSSEGGREASECCINGLLMDYYSTPDTWTVKTSGERVIASINAWLYSNGQRRYSSEHALASTLSVLILKSTTAHCLHVGDSRIYRIRDGHIHCLTQDHHLVLGDGKEHLSRAMGGEPYVCVDYHSHDVQSGDVYVLTTDGIHNFVCDADILAHISAAGDGDDTETATALTVKAVAAGSHDNVSCQIVRVDQLPNQNEGEFLRDLGKLPFPPVLRSEQVLDGYRVIRALHDSTTIQLYLVEDQASGQQLVMKTPSVNFVDDPAYIERFVHEEWVARRIDNDHVLRIPVMPRKRSCLYYLSEFLPGQSLTQWRKDHSIPDLDSVRNMAQQIVKGLRAFHRREMVHQDLKLDNIMISPEGKITIIDFGCTHVSGLKEVYTPVDLSGVQGTANYIAPELFQGYEGTPRSDMFSFGVCLYELLSGGHYPYKKIEHAKARKRFDYLSITQHNSEVPVWLDRTLQRSVNPDPDKRYPSYSELLRDLSQPNPLYIQASGAFFERNPRAFWQGLSVLLLISNLLLMYLFLTKP